MRTNFQILAIILKMSTSFHCYKQEHEFHKILFSSNNQTKTYSVRINSDLYSEPSARYAPQLPIEAATKALLYLCPGIFFVHSQNLSRVSTANLTLFSNNDSASSIDSPLDTNPGIVACPQKASSHIKMIFHSRLNISCSTLTACTLNAKNCHDLFFERKTNNHKHISHELK